MGATKHVATHCIGFIEYRRNLVDNTTKDEVTGVEKYQLKM